MEKGSLSQRQGSHLLRSPANNLTAVYQQTALICLPLNRLPLWGTDYGFTIQNFSVILICAESS